MLSSPLLRLLPRHNAREVIAVARVGAVVDKVAGLYVFFRFVMIDIIN